VGNFNQGVYPSPSDCCYLGVGVVRLAPWDSWQQSWGYHWGQSWGQQADPISFDPSTNTTLVAPAFRDVGEANRLDIDVRTKTNALPRYDGCGGEQCATEMLDGIDVTLGLDCLSWANIVQAFNGQLTELDFEIPNQQSWGYDWGSGWGANPAPVDPLTGQALPIPQGVAIARMAMFAKCYNKPVALLFEGRNVMTGAGMTVFIPKLKLGMAKRMPLISDDIADLTLTGRVLHAGDRGPGRSPYIDLIYTT
jgi:hypothetical protein